jgi:methyl-accepting chemotaxis protein
VSDDLTDATIPHLRPTGIAAGVQDAVAGLVGALADATGSSAAAIDELARVRDRMAHIEQILRGIDGVAEQTRVLALNARIAAARNDTRARVFETVSVEMRRLADHCRETGDAVRAVLAELRGHLDAARTALAGLSDAELAQAALLRDRVDHLLGSLLATLPRDAR